MDNDSTQFGEWRDCPRCGRPMVKVEDITSLPFPFNPHVTGRARYFCPVCQPNGAGLIRPADNPITENELRRVLQTFFRDIPLMEYQVKLILAKARSMGFDVIAQTRDVPPKEAREAMRGERVQTIIFDEMTTKAEIAKLKDIKRRRKLDDLQERATGLGSLFD